MSQQTLKGAFHPRLLMPMTGRDPHEQGRASTPLELFFDLVSVVAIALAAERLHHALIDGFGLQTIVSYVIVFFAVWWAWAYYTWFASAYDNDDVFFRVGTFVIMVGALILAAGVPQAFDEHVFTLAVTGYVTMRLGLVAQLVRVTHAEPARAQTIRRYAIGIAIIQIGWIAMLFVPDLWLVAFAVLVPLELLVPTWAQRSARLGFHNEHLTERYGLFMIIVLGESVLAGSLAIQSVLGEQITPDLVGVIVGGLLILFSMWWIYFDRPEEHLLDSLAAAQIWNYLHLLIFGSVAAVGAGLVVSIEEATGHAHVGWVFAGLAVAVPLALYLLGLWLIYVRGIASRFHWAIVPAAIVLVLAAAFAPMPILVVGLITAGTVAVKVGLRVREERGHDHDTLVPESLA